MASNQKGGSKQSGNTGSKSGVQGGTHEQHVEAGRQSHKNTTGNKQSGSGGSSSGGSTGGKSGGSKSR